MIITHQRMINNNEQVVDEIWLISGINKQQGKDNLPELGWEWKSGNGRNPGGWFTKSRDAVEPFIGKVNINIIDGPVSVNGKF